MTPPVIELDRVRFTHGAAPGGPAFTLHIDQLRIAPGEVVACIGPSGSGKTTLLDLIAGIHAPESGTIRVAGHDLGTLDPAQRRKVRLREIGLVFQTLALVEYLTALENILLPTFVEPALNAGSKADLRARALAEQLEIAPLLGRRPRRLSQGERQRVAICRALVASPRVLLCDEPTGNLDPARKDRTIDLLLEAGRTSGAAVLMATHDHSLLSRFDTIIDMARLHGGAA